VEYGRISGEDGGRESVMISERHWPTVREIGEHWWAWKSRLNEDPCTKHSKNPIPTPAQLISQSVQTIFRLKAPTKRWPPGGRAIDTMADSGGGEEVSGRANDLGGGVPMQDCVAVEPIKHLFSIERERDGFGAREGQA
ncbi:hypothetical protein U1Q18_036664, partial [Sarracenia purpurea var. burkii]